jgi:hypothetical protein
MKELVLNDMNKKINVKQQKIIRDFKELKISTDAVEKDYGLVYDERILNEDFTTYQFEYENKLKISKPLNK